MLPRNRFASERYNSPVVDSDSPFFWQSVHHDYSSGFHLIDSWKSMFAVPGLLFCTFYPAHPSNFLRSKLLILGLLNRLTLLKARLQMGDVDFSHVLQDRHRLLDAEGYHGICRLPFGFFSTAGLKSVVLLHTRMLERKWKTQSMRFSKPVVHQTFAYSSVLRCSSAD